jgi:hypothetical protein
MTGFDIESRHLTPEVYLLSPFTVYFADKILCSDSFNCKVYASSSSAITAVFDAIS